jgi:hypothetical protein
LAFGLVNRVVVDQIAWEREHVGRLVLLAVASVQCAHRAVGGEDERQLSRHTQRARRALERAPQARRRDALAPLAVHEHDLQHGGAYLAWLAVWAS